VIGDHHLGMLSWDKETGEDWDMDIAERMLCDAVDALVGLAPETDEAMIVNVGDFFHADNYEGTTKSGHALDVDTRWSRLVRVGIRTMKRCIETALTKHARVRVINEIGNHDERTSIMLSLALLEFYSNDDRVTVDESPSPFHYYRFGKNLIGVTHGNRVKAADLPGVMAADRAEDWGATEFRRWITGHVHHDQTKEYRGCIVETFRTLAAKDAWHHASGYRSGRDMKCLVLHTDHGEILRHTVGVGMLS